MKVSDISEIFSSPLRIVIVSSLLSKDMLFSELKECTEATDGNLSVHLKKLNAWGVIESKKVRIKDKILTSYKLTEFGKAEFENYVLLLESILRK